MSVAVCWGLWTCTAWAKDITITIPDTAWPGLSQALCVKGDWEEAKHGPCEDFALTVIDALIAKVAIVYDTNQAMIATGQTVKAASETKYDLGVTAP